MGVARNTPAVAGKGHEAECHDLAEGCQHGVGRLLAAQHGELLVEVGERVPAGQVLVGHVVNEQQVTVIALPAAAPPTHWQFTNALIGHLVDSGATFLRERDELAPDTLRRGARAAQRRVERHETARSDILASRGWVSDRAGITPRSHTVSDVTTAEKLSRRRSITGLISTSPLVNSVLERIIDTAISEQPDLLAKPQMFQQLEAGTAGACHRVESMVAGITEVDDDVVLAIEGAMVDHLEEHLVDDGYEVAAEAWRHIAWSRSKPRGGRTRPVLGARAVAVPT